MLFADGPAVLVDLSNVCRADDLCAPGKRADFVAFIRVLKALNATPWPLGNVLAIADRSLQPLFDPSDRDRYGQFQDRGYIDEAPVADDLLIGYAFDPDSEVRGAVIVSRDGFADFRPDYPEIQGCTDRFIGWTASNIRRPELAWRNMGFFTHQRMSRKAEEGEFKGRHILSSSVRDRATRTAFSCTNRACLLAVMWPERLQEFPDYDRKSDEFRCPGCGGQLEEVGQRPASRQVIVSHDQKECRRLLVEAGSTIIFGRTDRTGTTIGPGNDVPSSVTKPISRKHLRLGFQDGQLTVQDLGSKNGTLIEDRHNGKRRHLPAHAIEVLTRQRRIVLPGGITLELSGRQHPVGGDHIGNPVAQTDPDLIRRTIARY